MENKHKQFNPFDKVLVRELFPYWCCDLYSHFNSNLETHETTTYRNIKDSDILPYEGNEHLLGTTDEPEEEIELKEGDMIVCEYDINCLLNGVGNIRYFSGETHHDFIIVNPIKPDGCRGSYAYFIPFSKFNPKDMEETKKHILCVKNGKIVRYKS